ncbi:MAG: 2-phosphosulfolactate phosphatase [Clostridia bacterium]|nr:2-phosphosulfolactate phosphatase [Clostridia bacterium]
MEVEVFPTFKSVADEHIHNKTIIVVDVLRATTTITMALAEGCLEVIPVLTPEEAIAMRTRLEDKRVLLGGERNSVKIPGFDLGNSPLECIKQKIKGKRLIMTTTNGTQAIRRASNGKEIFLGAIVNAQAVAKRAAATSRDIGIICAGTRELFSIDDFFTAGLIVNYLLDNGEFDLRDGALAAMEYYRFKNISPVEVFRSCYHGKTLIEKGMEEDLIYCAKENLVNVVPVYDKGIIKREDKII